MRKSLLIVTAAVAATGGTGIALAAEGESERAVSAIEMVESTDRVAVADSVDVRLERSMRLFRTESARSQEPALPDSVKNIVGDLAGKSGANWRLARSVRTPAGTVYVVPGTDSVCQIGPGFGGCGDLDRLSGDPAGYVQFAYSQGFGNGGAIAVSGLVTDDVESIDAVATDGTRTAIPLTSNAYAAFLPVRTQRVVYQTRNGARSVQDVPDINRAP